MSVLVSCHVDSADPVAAATALGADGVQIFLGDPQGWKGPQCALPGGFAQLGEELAAAGLALWVHAPYVLNLASTNNRIRIPSRKVLQQTMTAAAQAGARGVIVHGGHVTAGDDPAAGVDNWRKAIEGTEFTIPLLIENTAGGQHAMARRLSDIDRLWAVIGQCERAELVGFCLDTCHANAAGIELGGLVEAVRAITGRIDLVHANDSRDAFGSGADRHANLGAGTLDPQALAEVVRSAGAPVVIETPGPLEAQRADIAWLRERLG